MRYKNYRVFLIGTLSVFIALAVLLYNFYPTHSQYFPQCPVKSLLGFYCPGCGNTRALYALITGDLGNSVKQNILFVPTVCFVILLLIFPRLRRSRVVALAVLIIIVLYAILRNIPCYPFYLLAPH